MDDLLEKYKEGGWFANNWLDLLKIAGGAALTATGAGAGIGTGLMVSGGLGMLTPDGVQDTTIPASSGITGTTLPPLDSTPKQWYLPTFQGGGGMLTDITAGGTHEEHPEGGINIGNKGLVEEDETIFVPEQTVNSDDIIITERMAEEYNLPKSAIGITIAHYTRRVKDKYPKRREAGSDKWSEDAEYEELSKVARLSRAAAAPRTMEEVGENLKQYQEGGSFVPWGNDSSLPNPDEYMKKYTGDKIGPDWNNILGLAPLAINALSMLGTMRAKPEEVDYPLIEGDYERMLFDPSQALTEAERTYGGLKKSIRETAGGNVGKYLSGMIQATTEEEQAKSNIIDAFAQKNVEEYNRNRLMRFYKDRENAMIQRQEAIDRAANEAALQSARRFDTAQFATGLGQYARDRRLMEEDKRYKDRLLDLLETKNYKWREGEGWDFMSTMARMGYGGTGGMAGMGGTPTYAPSSSLNVMPEIGIGMSRAPNWYEYYFGKKPLYTD